MNQSQSQMNRCIVVIVGSNVPLTFVYALPVGDRCLYLVFGCIELQIVPTQGKGNYYCHAMYYCIQPSAEESPKPKDEVKWCQKICDMWGCHNSSYSDSWRKDAFFFSLRRGRRLHDLAALQQQHLFLTSSSDNPNRIILGWKMNFWQNLTWIPPPQLEAKQRASDPQACCFLWSSSADILTDFTTEV